MNWYYVLLTLTSYYHTYSILLIDREERQRNHVSSTDPFKSAAPFSLKYLDNTTVPGLSVSCVLCLFKSIVHSSPYPITKRMAKNPCHLFSKFNGPQTMMNK